MRDNCSNVVNNKGIIISRFILFPVTDSKSLKASVYGIIGGVAYPYPLPNSNACETEDIECPLESGKTYDVENVFEVRPNYPPVSTIHYFI